MELRLHVEVPGVGVRGVFLDIDGERTIADLIGALVARWQLPVDPRRLAVFVRRREGWLDPRETVRATGLRSGDQIVLSAPDAPGAPTPDEVTHGVAELLVTGGPQAGAHVPLPPGEHQVGRSRECDVHLGDPALSRVHLLVDVSQDGEVVVQDARSSNGSFVDGLRLTQRSILRDGQEVEVGRSLVGFAPNGANGAAALDPQGRVPLNRPPRMVPHPPQLSHKLPPPPDKQRSIGFSLSAAILPIPIAIVLWFATQQALMLLLTLTSPLMVLGSWLEGRWGSKRD